MIDLKKRILARTEEKRQRDTTEMKLANDKNGRIRELGEQTINLIAEGYCPPFDISCNVDTVSFERNGRRMSIQSLDGQEKYAVAGHDSDPTGTPEQVTTDTDVQDRLLDWLQKK